MSPNAKILVRDIIQKARNHGVKVVFYPKKTHMGNAGWFHADDKILFVCRRYKDWLPVLIHESCHMDQWIENSKIWQITYKIDEKYLDPMKYYYSGELKLSKRTITSIVHRNMDLELDCEKRTVKKLKEYGLQMDIDIADYIRDANLYIYSYRIELELGRRLSLKERRKIKKATLKKMPSRFLKNYYRLPKKVTNYL